MSKKLVAYFSASGVTKSAAEKLAKEIGADLFEIVPEKPYTKADLNWQDSRSRSSVEMKDRNARPDPAAADSVKHRRIWQSLPRVRGSKTESVSLPRFPRRRLKPGRSNINSPLSGEPRV